MIRVYSEKWTKFESIVETLVNDKFLVIERREVVCYKIFPRMQEVTGRKTYVQQNYTICVPSSKRVPAFVGLFCDLLYELIFLKTMKNRNSGKETFLIFQIYRSGYRVTLKIYLYSPPACQQEVLCKIWPSWKRARIWANDLFIFTVIDEKYMKNSQKSIFEKIKSKWT